MRTFFAEFGSNLGFFICLAYRFLRTFVTIRCSQYNLRKSDVAMVRGIGSVELHFIQFSYCTIFFVMIHIDRYVKAQKTLTKHQEDDMAILEWDEKISTGIKKIDTQHKELVRIVNELHEAMKVGKGKDKLIDTVKFLANYTVDHFATEEQLMQQHKYPEYTTHKKQHDALIHQVTDLIAKVSAGSILLTLQVTEFLAKWVKEHILANDLKLGAFLKSKGVE